MGMTAAGGLVSANGQYQAGKTNQAIARSNAVVARAQGQQAVQAGEFAAGNADNRGRKIQSQQQAALASSGTVVGAGTNAQAMLNSEQASGMDALMIRRQAAREALGYEIKASGDELQGDMAAAAGKTGAISTLLNAGSQMWLEGDSNYGGYKGKGIKVK